MKAARVAGAAIGALVALAGLTFTLQGYGVVGPQSSFMYTNQSWVYIGGVLLALGVVVVAASLRVPGRRTPGSAAK
jgi:hypothetical protein